MVLVFLVLQFFVCVASPHALGKTKKKTRKSAASGVTAAGVYAFDDTNKKVLFSRSAHVKFYPASTTKLLTALVVLEHLSLDRRVVISSRASGVEPTRAGLSAGVEYSVEDLLKILLSCSANDAAVALAEAVSGSEASFALLMNKKAKGLGAKKSHFKNASGLPDPEQVTTPYDLMLITRAAFSRNFVQKAMALRQVTIKGSDEKTIKLYNHNKLLWRLNSPRVLGKTGYTKAARHCYAGVAYYSKKKILIVILKSRKPWSDVFNILGIRQRKKRT